MNAAERLPHDPDKRFVVLMDCGRYFETYAEAISTAKIIATANRRVVVAQVMGHVAPGGVYREVKP